MERRDLIAQLFLKPAVFWPMAIFSLAIGTLAGLWLGMDAPWDYYSYHAYAAELLLHDRLGQDYFAGGQQGYMNPVGFLPFALAKAMGWSAQAIGVLLSALHSLNFFFLLLLSRDMVRANPARAAFALPGALLGALSPVLLIHLGSTFLDPLAAALVMAALWLVLGRETKGALLSAGLLVAAAIAIKPTNLVFGVALMVCVLLRAYWRVETPAKRACHTRVLAFVGGGMLGVLLLQGWWSWKLYQLTGNPAFPFLNSIFHSTWLPASSVLVGRFVPDSLIAALGSPLSLARLSSWIYLEVPAPSIVPLVTVFGLIAAGLIAVLSRVGLRHGLSVGRDGLICVVFVMLSWCLWLKTSGNARYAIPLFLAQGPALAVLFAFAFPKRYALLLLWLACLIQGFVVWNAGIVRWNSQQWPQHWVNVTIPRQLVDKPYLFISVAGQSHSEIVPHLHPRSAFMHLNNGHYPIPSEGPASIPLWRLIHQSKGRIKVVIDRPIELKGVTISDEQVIRSADLTLDRVGLKMDDADCNDVAINADMPVGFQLNHRLPMRRMASLLVCSGVVAEPRLAVERARAAAIFDAFEARCPDIFQPARPQIENAGGVWFRSYAKLDSLNVFIVDGGEIMYSLSGQFRGIKIGNVASWQEDVARFDCRLPYDGKRGFSGFQQELGTHGGGKRAD